MLFINLIYFSSSLFIPYIKQLNSSSLVDSNKILSTLTPEIIKYNNWAEQYPETPYVRFAISHNNNEIFIRFFVEENYTVAHVTEDNGKIWTDSACEFFVSFDDKTYYNIEVNCIGRCLIGYHDGVNTETRGSTDKIKRLSSLGTEPFDEIIGANKWNLFISIPKESFWMHTNLLSNGFSSLKIRCNFYKCGDSLTKPHFLSWSPIKSENPNFHLPEFFGDAEFEKFYN